MFGLNPIVSQHLDDAGALKVVDMFYTLQGEGPYSGMTSVFVRLADCNLRCVMCFVPSTMIKMGDFTSKRIDQIAVGDLVLSWSGSEFVKKRVTKTMRSFADTVIRVDAGGLPVFCTPEHPFLVSGKGWVEASNLQPGDKLVHFSGSDAARMNNSRTRAKANALHERVGQYISNGKVVKSVTVVNDKGLARIYGAKDAPKEVFNFEVEDTHTYVANGMVVHNCDTDFTTGARVVDVEELVQQVRTLAGTKTRLVVITGGEPLLQNIVPFCRLLAKYNFRVQIETAGTVWVPGLESCDVAIVCSPKTGKVRREIQSKCINFKYVVGVGDEIRDGGIIASYQVGSKPMLLAQPGRPDATIWIQPRDDQNPEKNAANTAFARDLCLKYGHRMCVQLHKIVGVA